MSSSLQSWHFHSFALELIQSHEGLSQPLVDPPLDVIVINVCAITLNM